MQYRTSTWYIQVRTSSVIQIPAQAQWPTFIPFLPLQTLVLECLSRAAVDWVRVRMRANILIAFLRVFVCLTAQMLLLLLSCTVAGVCSSHNAKKHTVRHKLVWISSVWLSARVHKIILRRKVNWLPGRLPENEHADLICTDLCLGCHKGFN